MKLFSYILFVLFMIAACQLKEANPDCGCEGSSVGSLTNVMGVYSRTNITTLDSVKQYTGTYLVACGPDLITGRISNGDTVILSGTALNFCYDPNDIIEHPGLLKLITVRKK